MKITPLGTNGFFPSFNRHTACYVVPYKGTLIILDAGSGLFRFTEPEGKKLLKNIRHIDLFLSHYHLDHTFGFYAAFTLLKGKSVTVYGMKDTKVFKDLTKMDLFPVDFEKSFSHFSWKKLESGQLIGDYTVRTRRQYHRGEGSLGLRFEFPNGKILSYITDSEPNQESVEFIKNSDLLLHEGPLSGEDLLKKNALLEDHCVGGHVTTVGAAMVAKEAYVKKLYLIHHDPFKNLSELKKQEKLAQSIFNESYLAKDLEEIEF